MDQKLVMYIQMAFLFLINQDRVGLNPLTYCNDLQPFATARAQQQASWDSLSHFVDDRLAIDSIVTPSRDIVGENLAGSNLGIDPAAFNTALMNSPKHRDNIMDSRFTCVAIGINNDNTIVSQIFAQELTLTMTVVNTIRTIKP